MNHEVITTIITWKRPLEEMPDSDITVLGYNENWGEPVWPCFWDSESNVWRDVSAEMLDKAPMYWADFPEGPDKH